MMNWTKVYSYDEAAKMLESGKEAMVIHYGSTDNEVSFMSFA
eukprot:CAMPEP_0184026122 /NCGR_PEP_ID=MMETSP0954-20121128/13305_1 /TAXON_ID=627963 /ORGANISM="Aplanochytrium sp, Strain PBS07" /LENGTH=41 /DNA_ID= /DNA_START= /DNA_END= /DNA_ORIENTATION=